MPRRRRVGLTIIRWRDIPAQVTASDGDVEVRQLLPPRFQRAIDRAARTAGLTDHHAYIGAWRRERRPLDGAPREVVAAVVERLDAEHDRATLRDLVGRGGVWRGDPSDALPGWAGVGATPGPDVPAPDDQGAAS